MRPFQQADPNTQLMLVHRGDQAGTLGRDRAAAARAARRPVVGAGLAALAFRKFFVLSQVARTDIERNRARTA